MKRCVCLFLIAVLLLSGCEKNAEVQTQPTTTAATTATGLYDPDHPVELETEGAVHAYPLTGANYQKIIMMGSRMLLLQEDGSGTVLQGDNCDVVATGRIVTIPEEGRYGAGMQGIAVFHELTNEVVLYNPQLQEANRFLLPDGIQGLPVISMENYEIYYCYDGAVRAINMENGVPRLLKSHDVAQQALTGCYFGGKVLRCETVDAAGAEAVLYIASENGMVLSHEENITHFDSLEDRYFIRRLDNGVQQNIVGTYEGEAKSLSIPNMETQTVVAALAMNGAISYSQKDAGLSMSFHNFATEQTEAQILLANAKEPVCVAADESYIWFIVQEDARQVLYRWDVTQSQIAEPVTVLQTLFTAQTPDTDGIAVCQERVNSLNERYGVKIQIWQDAVQSTDQYAVVPEYQPQVIDRMLDQLEPAMQKFPEKFLSTTIRSGKVKIGLVRSISDGSPWVQFWKDGNLCILISSQTDASNAFMETIGYGIDSHVIGNSRDYDTWSKLNPEGFTYGAELPKNESGNVLYLDGESRAFVSQRGMESPVEDRRLLFAAAVAEGNEELFVSETMQAKLRRMCEGIREAYGLEKKQEVYLWEQYLKVENG